jgi:uncharacterized protein (TIGR01777 family)
MNILVSGGTGFIGSALVATLVRQGHRIAVLTRTGSSAGHPPDAQVRLVPWNSREITDEPQSLGAIDAIVNLAGASLADGRWTASRKAAIINSRRNVTRALRNVAAALTHRPRVLVNSSAVGYYGSVPTGEVHEDHAAGSDFLAGVCKAWEEEALSFADLGIRVVRLRFGIVLGRSGGALGRMALPFRLGVGGNLGTGRQWFPWIHLEDAIGLISYSLANPEVEGPLNATAPESVTSHDFARTLGTVLRRPSWAHVPAPVLKAVLGEMSGMVLTGQNAVPSRALALGYVFRHPTLEGALKDILR